MENKDLSSKARRRKLTRQHKQERKRAALLARFPFVKDFNLDPTSEAHLLSDLTRTLSGSYIFKDKQYWKSFTVTDKLQPQAILTTEFGNANGPEALLKAWDKIYDKNSSKFPDVLDAIEQKNKSKYGPRSISKPWQLRKGDLYDSFAKFELTNDQINELVNCANYISSQTDEVRLRPTTFTRAFNSLKANTAAGLPTLGKKFEWREKFRGFLNEKYPNQDLESQLTSYYDDYQDVVIPCLLFTRTQEGDKTRNVWGFPAQNVVKEQRFYLPLLTHQKSLKWRSALTDADNVDHMVTELMNAANASGEQIVSIDFSTYDNSVKRDLARVAFRYISWMFDDKYHDEIQNLEIGFSTIPIVTPDGVITGWHGVPSGSTFTNEVDSIVQYCVAVASGVIGRHAQIQGDDGLYTTNNPDKLFKTFKDHGLNVNEDKSDVSNEYCTFLQKLYHPSFRLADGVIPGVYSSYRALMRLVYPESLVSKKTLKSAGVSTRDYNSIRAIQILENCKNHPLFFDLVRFVNDRWEDQCLSVINIKAVNKMREFAKQNPGSFKQQYGDNLSSWESFKTNMLLSVLNKDKDLAAIHKLREERDAEKNKHDNIDLEDPEDELDFEV